MRADVGKPHQGEHREEAYQARNSSDSVMPASGSLNAPDPPEPFNQQVPTQMLSRLEWPPYLHAAIEHDISE
jgi:hypothetical protein